MASEFGQKIEDMSIQELEASLDRLTEAFASDSNPETIQYRHDHAESLGEELHRKRKIMELILAECKKNLVRGRSVATGIGVFAVLIKMDEKVEGYPRSPQVLLRRRLEKGSLYGTDLSGKWEMTGGGVELAHFQGSPPPYQVAILAALLQELKEEAGLVLAAALPKYSFLLPAWLFNDVKGVIDLAFAIPIPWKWVRETDESRRKFERGEIRFFRPDELSKIEIVSPRTSFLIKDAIDYASHYWP